MVALRTIVIVLT